MKKHIFIYIFIFINAWRAHSTDNDVPHINFWSRLSLNFPVTEKWKFEAEFQHRRQNNYVLKTKDLFDENLLSSFLSWVHYAVTKDFYLSLSPFEHYRHKRIIIREADIYAPQAREIRFSAAAGIKHEIVKKLYVEDRTCTEYRDFLNTHLDVVRLRNRFGFRYELLPQLDISI